MSKKDNANNAGKEADQSLAGCMGIPDPKEGQRLPSVPSASAIVQPKVIPLKCLLSWDFNIFEYNEQYHTAFTDVSFNIMKHFGADKVLKVDDDTILKWLYAIEHTYDNENPYHNSIHAADVLQATAFMLETQKLKELLSVNDRTSLIVAAIAHDVHHPGLVNSALKKLGHPLSLACLGGPPLESHHVQMTFQVTEESDDCNIFKNLGPLYTWFKEDISALIYATDMDQHKRHEILFLQAIADATSREGKLDQKKLYSSQNLELIKKIVLKWADISATQRPLLVHVMWVERICEEFFRQTALEKEGGIDPTLPAFERGTCIIPDTQLMFLSQIRALIEAWLNFTVLPDLLANFNTITEFWHNIGHKCFTFDDIKRSIPKNEI